MKKNMGRIDKSIRIILALIFATLYYAGVISGVFGIIILILAAIFVLTSFIGFCPLYAPFKINTCSLKGKK
ncbi:DUF2892 domain-containing protein [uncultured Polaribacter sp.]|uniref:YgaP family membrane protein n=1 Tax=uncultured Polaribacter sp. TaxID=174711 RepID=UPI00261BBD1E|nr:DUF2892 domain-containing protein [uncultured Polaribacter sp.]